MSTVPMRTVSMSTVLLTGFEPFAGETTNPSWLAVQRAQELWEGPEALDVLELPVEFGRAAEVLNEAIERLRPELVIAVGQAGGRATLALERVAINVDDARIPDNAGASPVDAAIVVGGPAAYFATLPIKAALAALTREGIPAVVSQTAGTFVCNHVFYALMHALAGAAGDEMAAGEPAEGVPGRDHRRGPRGGFVHVPYAPEQAAGTSHPSMTVETMATGLVSIVRTSLTTTTDMALAAGATH
ncbi:pyroglutamyl-peptidase I Cysteine peptidase. MEROPS family C15 [Sanguibacter gelidistatuariae]|uniref:Pyrrolidone-carboxylate peptidase n=1 Tax=Sanguibacter gelidistatuariae TaxID=1814289 RepID=A0A1G6H5Q7_9MICO|nr:pyroglutamyl-peptidase I [Sanguibacter gelidistatuariae]SDB89473.1 pyroglutamyl-peptidase I Cysteine peptidase. MEROPS family C15 [Sanguibacter gelidistatuariae]